jgi:hypothetical protein
MKRRCPQLLAALVMTLGGSTVFGACNSDLALEFRAAAGSGLQEGLKTITDSLIDGIFAVLTPDSTNGA